MCGTVLTKSYEHICKCTVDHRIHELIKRYIELSTVASDSTMKLFKKGVVIKRKLGVKMINTHTSEKTLNYLRGSCNI